MDGDPTPRDSDRGDGERPDDRDEATAIDAAEPDPGAADPAEPPFERPIDKFRRTATGSVVAAGLLGLRDAMEGRPEKEEVTIVSEAPTRPVGNLDIVIDPDHPERTIAIVRRPPPDEKPQARSDR